MDSDSLAILLSKSIPIIMEQINKELSSSEEDIDKQVAEMATNISNYCESENDNIFKQMSIVLRSILVSNQKVAIEAMKEEVLSELRKEIFSGLHRVETQLTQIQQTVLDINNGLSEYSSISVVSKKLLDLSLMAETAKVNIMSNAPKLTELSNLPNVLGDVCSTIVADPQPVNLSQNKLFALVSSNLESYKNGENNFNERLYKFRECHPGDYSQDYFDKLEQVEFSEIAASEEEERQWEKLFAIKSQIEL